MAFFTKNLPPCFEMLGMMELAAPLLSQESSPYVVVALQECQRMNVLLTEVRRSLVELDKGTHSPFPFSFSFPVPFPVPFHFLSTDYSLSLCLILPLFLHSLFTPSPTDSPTPSVPSSAALSDPLYFLIGSSSSFSSSSSSSSTSTSSSSHCFKTHYPSL